MLIHKFCWEELSSHLPASLIEIIVSNVVLSIIFPNVIFDCRTISNKCINRCEFVTTLKDTEKKTLSNKTSALTRSTDMDMWVVVTSNQIFIRGS